MKLWSKPPKSGKRGKEVLSIYMKPLKLIEAHDGADEINVGPSTLMIIFNLNIFQKCLCCKRLIYLCVTQYMRGPGVPNNLEHVPTPKKSPLRKTRMNREPGIELREGAERLWSACVSSFGTWVDIHKESGLNWYCVRTRGGCFSRFNQNAVPEGLLKRL